MSVLRHNSKKVADLNKYQMWPGLRNPGQSLKIKFWEDKFVLNIYFITI